jgi:hypothetical protein
MSERIAYFGYGANRDPRMMGWILGQDPDTLTGYLASLDGYGLAIQRLDQVPDKVVQSAPIPRSARDLLKENWDEDFMSYVIFPSPGDKVSGVMWELTPEDRERVRDWELIDFGWYEDVEVSVRDSAGDEHTVVTERLGSGQEFAHEVYGTRYVTWLNDPEKFRVVAEKAAREYDERLGPEGGRPNPDINKA